MYIQRFAVFSIPPSRSSVKPVSGIAHCPLFVLTCNPKCVKMTMHKIRLGMNNTDGNQQAEKGGSSEKQCKS